MKTLILLGTPKKDLRTSSSSFIANAMSEGMKSKPDIKVIAHEELENIYSVMNEYDTVLLITPNYIHSVPAHVLEFLYKLPQNEKKQNFAVIIQSGFPEERDSYYIKKYIDNRIFACGYNYLGCAVIGDAAAYGLVPDMCKNRIPLFVEFGESFEKNCAIDFEYITSSGISMYYELPEKAVKKLEFMRKIGIGKFAWIYLLKKNKAYKRRYDKPYM